MVRRTPLTSLARRSIADVPVVDGSLWFYAPNKEAPVVFALLFLVSGILHGYQCM
jgi:hypothetical protein